MQISGEKNQNIEASFGLTHCQLSSKYDHKSMRAIIIDFHCDFVDISGQ